MGENLKTVQCSNYQHGKRQIVCKSPRATNKAIYFCEKSNSEAFKGTWFLECNFSYATSLLYNQESLNVY